VVVWVVVAGESARLGTANKTVVCGARAQAGPGCAR